MIYLDMKVATIVLSSQKMFFSKSCIVCIICGRYYLSIVQSVENCTKYFKICNRDHSVQSRRSSRSFFSHDPYRVCNVAFFAFLSFLEMIFFSMLYLYIFLKAVVRVCKNFCVCALNSFV